jgi:hypothetical protein
MLTNFFPPLSPIWNGLRNKIPKFLRMIHLRQVAQLMNNDVIHQVRRQQRNLIIEIQIPSPRTTPPSRPLIPDCNTFPRESIDEIEVRNARSDQFQRPIFILGDLLLRIEAVELLDAELKKLGGLTWCQRTSDLDALTTASPLSDSALAHLRIRCGFQPSLAPSLGDVFEDEDDEDQETDLEFLASLREFSVGKNRFGPPGLRAVVQMTSRGIHTPDRPVGDKIILAR